MIKKDRIQKLLHRVQFEDLSPAYLRQLVGLARSEDLEGAGLHILPRKSGDVTSVLLAQPGSGEATLVAREPLVICGLPMVSLVLEAYHQDLRFEPETRDGSYLKRDEVLGIIRGPTEELLMAERVILNFLQFLSGIASETTRYVEAIGNTPTRILDTRKTTPGYRMLQKYAVACGGGWNHRLGLFDRVMLKDNHLAAGAAQSGKALTELVHKARKQNPDCPVEVEVDNLDQIDAALEASPDKLMLDNFTIQELQTAVNMIGDKACTEATGGITLKTLPDLGKLGLDFVSTGALVHQAVWKDIGLDWK